MIAPRDYRTTAQENELVFRNILRDMKHNRGERPGGQYIPDDLETDATIEDFFKKYSTGNRYGIFTITDFSRPSKKSAFIAFKDVAFMSGGGAKLEYIVKPDASVKFRDSGFFMS